MKFVQLTFMGGLALLTAACTSPLQPHDYSAFRNSDPASILILPPINNTTEVIAPYSVLSHMANPIAESGFYVFPVALVEQTFRTNGLTEATDVHALPIQKIEEIFKADAALYITIEEYGTSYVVISSETVVTLSATLLDLKTGDVLWQDRATASSAEGRGNSGGGLVGLLVEAAVNQIVETMTDKGFDIAKISTNRLSSSELYNGLLHGPRSPKYGEPVESEK